MIILGLDSETTGLDVETDDIIELGLVIYDTDLLQAVAMHSDLFKTNKWSVEAEAVHNIKPESVARGRGRDFNPWQLVAPYNPTVIVAHNAEYDKGMTVRRWSEFDSIPWICTDKDLPHEKFIRKVSSTRLQHLAVDYGLHTPHSRHRALFDALQCCEIAAKHDLQRVLEVRREAQYLIQAWFSGVPNFNDPKFNKHKDYLKLAGFKWDGKRWNKNNVPASKVDKVIELACKTNGWQAESTLIKPAEKE